MTGQFGTLHTMPSPSGAAKANRRLDSWKEIAAFFGRDERTVKRWEKERALPVHRLPGGSRARVFAFSDELSQWMNSPELPSAAAGESNSAAEALPAATISVAPPTAVPGRGTSKSWIAAACVLSLAMAGVAIWRYHVGRPASLEAPVKAATHVNPEAEDLYLKGRYYWTQRTPADLNKAVDYFTQAIVRDPSYAQPYVGLADCYNLLREFAAMPSDEAFTRALAAAKKAVELDDKSAEAHASLAFDLFYWNWDAAAAEAEFRRAIELDPHYVAAHHWYATFLMANGRFDEAANEFEAAQKLDPASTPILADKALLLFNEGRLDEAELLLKQIETSQPKFFSTHEYLSRVYLAKRDYRRYLSEARQAALLAHDDSQLAIVHAAEQGFSSNGERGLLGNTLQIQKKHYAEGNLSPFFVAETAALLGRKDEALHYLREAYKRHDTYFLWTRIDVPLLGLRNDPDFLKLLAETGLAPRA